MLRQFQAADALQRIAGKVPVTDRPGLLYDRRDQQVSPVEAIEDERDFRMERDRAQNQQ
jgi:hypothetical protein